MDTSHVVDSGGVERSFLLHRPTSLPDPAPLVIMLHGGFGTGEQAKGAYGWDEIADSERFVVAYPNGLNRAWAVGGGCCGNPGRTGVDDVRFIMDLVKAVQDLVPIDPRRLYVTGMSNGAMMSYRLACDTDIFAAIGPVAGTQLGECASAAPVSLIHIHGLADENVRFDGAPGRGVAGIDGPPVPDVVAQWREVDDCGAPTESVNEPVTTSVAKCADEHEVRLVTVEGVDHQWPGGKGKTSNALDATEVIWEFFKTHQRRP